MVAQRSAHSAPGACPEGAIRASIQLQARTLGGPAACGAHTGQILLHPLMSLISETVEAEATECQGRFIIGIGLRLARRARTVRFLVGILRGFGFAPPLPLIFIQNRVQLGVGHARAHSRGGRAPTSLEATKLARIYPRQAPRVFRESRLETMRPAQVRARSGGYRCAAPRLGQRCGDVHRAAREFRRARHDARPAVVC